MYILSGAMFGVAAGGAAKAFHGLRVNYTRRTAFADAKKKTTTLGDAALASLSERIAEGLHNTASPMVIGSVGGIPVHIPKSMSCVIESLPGRGKTSMLFLFILQAMAGCGQSVIFQDVKGEAYAVWAEVLIKMGFRVYANNLALNPDYPCHDTNPLEPVKDAVRHFPHEAFIIAETIARALIKDTNDAKSQFFIANDRAVLVFVTIALAQYYPDDCFPGGVYRVIVNPKRFRALLIQAKDDNAIGGDLADLAENLLQKEIDNPEHFESARTGASNALSLYRPSSHLGQLGKVNDFDPKTLRDSKLPPAIVFDLIPASELEVYGPANALIQSSRLQTFRKYRDGRSILLCVDEGSNAPIPNLGAAIELLRSWKVTAAVAYQSEAGLIKALGEHEAKRLISSSCEVYFSVSSLERAKQISERIGQHTVKTASHGFDENGKPNLGKNETATTLLSPDQILSLPKHKAILLVPGIRPVIFDKGAWYRAEPFKTLGAENPHEQHPKSPVTDFAYSYGRDATEIGPPILKNKKQLYAAARARETFDNVQPVARRFVIREWLWVPLVSAFALAMTIKGTPHVLIDSYGIRGAHNAYGCAYYGLSGLRHVKVARGCSTFQNFRFRSKESIR